MSTLTSLSPNPIPAEDEALREPVRAFLKEALQTIFETGLPAIIYEETTGEDYHPVDGMRPVR
jgi:hypothetical protein